MASLGAGFHDRDRNRQRALAVADALAARYWTVDLVADPADGIDVPAVGFKDPRSRVGTMDPAGDRKTLTGRGVRVAAAYGAAQTDTHWTDPERLHPDQELVPGTALASAGAAALAALLEAGDESRLSAGPPAQVPTLSAVRQGDDAIVSWTWTPLLDNGSTLAGFDAEMDTGAGFANAVRRGADSRSVSWTVGAVAPGSVRFRVRPVGTLGPAQVHGPWRDTSLA